MQSEQIGNAAKCVFLLLLSYALVCRASNYTENYWLNETLTVDENDNVTINASVYRITSEISKDNSTIAAPLSPLTKIALLALVLHIVLVGGGLIVYSFVYCKSREAKRKFAELRQRLQSPLTLQHIPNAANCPCHGCRVAKQILSGLIVQQIISERLERKCAAEE